MKDVRALAKQQNRTEPIRPDSELRSEMDRLAIPARIPAGTILFRSGEPASAVFVVHSGRLALEPDADYRIVHREFCEAGEIAGLSGILNGSYLLTARAVEDSEVGYIPAPWLAELVQDDARLCASTMQLSLQELDQIYSGSGDDVPRKPPVSVQQPMRLRSTTCIDAARSIRHTRRA